MMGEEQNEARKLFLEVVALGTPAERARHLDAACRDKPELRMRLEALLRAHEKAAGFLTQDALGGDLDCDSSPISEGPGTIIGRYKLLEQIGEGGFGVVFMAEQLEPIRRKVALKIVKPGMDTRQVIARFEAERQALALMDHPNIAKIFDAGVTGDPVHQPSTLNHQPASPTPFGRPYFVMELVHGVPITEFCDANDLTPPERLKLFMTVCEAVQHAHQKGIIHRDLKPSNILVTLHDGKPVPKVIDFGTAKALQQSLTEKTLFTAYGKFIGTPQYTSPEQAELSGVDVDTRADIYSLGVLLYELLTGTTPFELERLRAAAFEEMMRIIREEDPPKPSTRLSTLGVRATNVAKHRQVQLADLRRTLRGDLDWIVMRALEKDRTRRYDTASALVKDLQHHLNHEPVLAGPPGRVYRARKFVRRHRMGVALAASLTLALVAGLVVSLIGFAQAKHERDRAMLAEAKALAEERRAESNYLTAREAVDKMLTRLATDLANQPRMARFRRELLQEALQFQESFLKQKGNDPELRHAAAHAFLRVGQINVDLGRFEESQAPFHRALGLFEALAQQSQSQAEYLQEATDAHSGLAYSGLWLGQENDCISHRRQVVALREALRRKFPNEPEHLAACLDAHVGLGTVLNAFNHSLEAVEEFQRARRVEEEIRIRFPDLPDYPLRRADLSHWLGATMTSLGRFEEAEREFRQAESLCAHWVAERAESPAVQGSLASIKAYFAGLLAQTGRHDEALAMQQEAVAIREELLGNFPENFDYLRRADVEFRGLGLLLRDAHRPTEAEAALRQSLKISSQLAREMPDEPYCRYALGQTTFELGNLLHEMNRADEAAKAFAESIAVYEQLAAEFPSAAHYKCRLGLILATCPMVRFRDPPRAVQLARQAVELSPKSPPNWNLLGIAQLRADDPAAAIEALQKSCALRDFYYPADCLYLAMAHWQKGERHQAERWYEQAISWISTHQLSRQPLNLLRAEAETLLGKNPAP